jgi:hypothetical protein
MTKSVSMKNPGQRGATAVVPSWLQDPLDVNRQDVIDRARDWYNDPVTKGRANDPNAQAMTNAEIDLWNAVAVLIARETEL